MLDDSSLLNLKAVEGGKSRIVNDSIDPVYEKRIYFSVFPSVIGNLLVAYTEHAIRMIDISDDVDFLKDRIRSEFPGSEKVEISGNLELKKGIEAFISGEDVKFNLKVDGTPFELEVWSALLDVPYGQTVSYSEIAKRIGKPRAVRAVANACAKNPIPLIIPCHRIIRKSGGLGGYGPGIEKKIALLEIEGSYTPKTLN
ncbi:MAG: methylated-DNA--[protein]-cysteine S-methyltransferase [Candidatus Thermoplasmatota archaeon]|jgi:O-6-methylguanine DNA methyltransferase|nr:methylated-DNA--[protein]-cysteine S-methyltransferase [Candidatus Thermoplasmatota archaeon]